MLLLPVLALVRLPILLPVRLVLPDLVLRRVLLLVVLPVLRPGRRFVR